MYIIPLKISKLSSWSSKISKELDRVERLMAYIMNERKMSYNNVNYDIFPVFVFFFLIWSGLFVIIGRDVGKKKIYVSICTTWRNWEHLKGPVRPMWLVCSKDGHQEQAVKVRCSAVFVTSRRLNEKLRNRISAQIHITSVEHNP